MKVLYDMVKELDPKDLWDSLNIETTYLTHEGIDAFLAIYQKILNTDSERGPCVLERVEKNDFDGRTVLFVINREMSLFPERITINKINLEKILGLYIPSMLYGVCHSTIINEIFRCLIREELERSEYKIYQMSRELKEQLNLNYKKLEENCELNLKRMEHEMRIYQVKGLNESIRKECREKIPDMGARISWDTLICKARITEQLCTSLLPSNPPTLSRLSEVKRIIETKIKDVCDSTSFIDHVEDLIRKMEENEMEQRNPHDKAYSHFKIKRYAKKTIIVDENYIPDVNIPIIYTVDQDGSRAEIDYRDLSDPLQYSIVVKNSLMKKNHTALAGYVLLYLAYPIRMHRMMKLYQIQRISYLLSQKK